jgi:hypothetical protein
METKRKKVLELSKQEPKLTRAEIARLVPCSNPYVTQILGAERSYKKQRNIGAEIIEGLTEANKAQ